MTGPSWTSWWTRGCSGSVIRGKCVEKLLWEVAIGELRSYHGTKMRWRDQMTGELQALGLRENWYQLCQNRTEWNDWCKPGEDQAASCRMGNTCAALLRVLCGWTFHRHNTSVGARGRHRHSPELSKARLSWLSNYGSFKVSWFKVCVCVCVRARVCVMWAISTPILLRDHEIGRLGSLPPCQEGIQPCYLFLLAHSSKWIWRPCKQFLLCYRITSKSVCLHAVSVHLQACTYKFACACIWML